MLNKIDTLTLNRKDLITKLQSIKKITPSHTKDELLKRAHLIAEEGEIFAVATNSDQVLKSKICETNVNLKGNFNATSVLNFLKKAKSEEVELSFNKEGALRIASGKINFIDTVFNEEMWDIEYKNPEKYEEEFTSFEITASELIKTFSEVQPSICTEEVRYYINGIFMHQNDEHSLNFVATNGHVLAKRVLKTEYNNAKDVFQKGVTIPKEAVKFLLDFAKKFSGDIKIKLTESCLSFKLGDLSLRTSLVNGNYPDYTRVIPRDTNLRISTDKTDLLEAIDLFTIQKTNVGIKFSFDVDKNVLELERPCKESGDLNAQVYSATDKPEIAESAVFGLTDIYVKQILNLHNGEAVDLHVTMIEKKDDNGTIFWTFDQAPIVVKSLKAVHSDDVNVIMPYRI